VSSSFVPSALNPPRPPSVSMNLTVKVSYPGRDLLYSRSMSPPADLMI